MQALGLKRFRPQKIVLQVLAGRWSADCVVNTGRTLLRRKRLFGCGLLGPPILRGAAAAIVAAVAAIGPAGARADTHLVLPSGLPTRVVPAFPEPGLPTFTYPQQNLTDTGGVAGATAATGTGSSDLTFGGTGSGVSRAILATGYSDLLGQSVRSGECVALVQATSNVGLTGTWVPGAQVEGNTRISRLGRRSRRSGRMGPIRTPMGRATRRFISARTRRGSMSRTSGSDMLRQRVRFRGRQPIRMSQGASSMSSLMVKGAALCFPFPLL